MPEIAPWENPNLPAPFVQVEREIEGRTRRFALWQWDERLVWNDLKTPRLWWATLDVAASLDDWERAIKDWQFGRAFSERCNFSGRGDIVGFHRSVLFSSDYRFAHDFHILVDAQGGGVARWSESEVWLSFDFDSYKRLKRQRRRIQRRPDFQFPLAIPIWKSNFQPPKLGNALLEGFKPTFLSSISPELDSILQRGEGAECFQAVKDLVTWLLRPSTIPRYQIPYFMNEIDRLYPSMTRKICERYGLSTVLEFGLTASRIPNLSTLFCHALVNRTVWSIHSGLNEISTAHELLELQLRLRDALKPILTPAEIEEILNPPARL